MNNDISNIGSISTTPLTSSSKPLKKEMDEQVKVDKKNQEKAEKNTPDSKVASLDEAKEIAKEGNKIFDNVQRNLQFKVDDTTKQVVMSIVDKVSGEVIKQLPSEEALALAQRMIEAEGDPGGIVEDKV